MKNILLILTLSIIGLAHSQTNTCQGTFTFGSGPCQRIIIGNGTPGQIEVCLTVNNIPVATGGNKCNPGGSCNPPFNGGGWNPGIYIYNSNSSGTNYAGMMVENWQGNAAIGCYTLTLSTGYAVLFGLCNINGTQISWSTINDCGQNACLNPLCDPLPIELFSFNGIKLGNNNLIEWITASEFNNDYFILERSNDGEIWDIIYLKTGSGNSNQSIKYTYNDYTFKNTINYYRLTQVDFDGQLETFNPISIDNNHNRYVINRTNMLGQNVDENYDGLVIIHYDDNTFEKKYNKKLD
jgi:hypothetical protein